VILPLLQDQTQDTPVRDVRQIADGAACDPEADRPGEGTLLSAHLGVWRIGNGFTNPGLDSALAIG
jgi:hypothetical protein